MFCLVLAGCGTPGAPQPPSLRLPRPVEDLAAQRRGDKVYLSWTQPDNTTDDQGIGAAVITTRVCRSYRVEMSAACRNAVADLKVADAGRKQQYVDDLSAFLQQNPSQDFVNYNVEINNAAGRNAGPSNAVTIFLAPSLPPASALAATLKAESIELRWTAAAPPVSPGIRTEFFYAVERSARDSAGKILATKDSATKDPASKEPVGKDSATRDSAAQYPANPALLGEVPARPGTLEFVDRNFSWEKDYRYSVVGMTHVLSREGKLLSVFPGEPATVAIAAHDTFAPAAPAGVEAVSAGAGTGRIDITWSPNEESDLAGYNVYRAVFVNGAFDDAAFVRISSELVKTPSFRDENAQPGLRYAYLVTAVDERGNESARSQPSSETVPEQP